MQELPLQLSRSICQGAYLLEFSLLDVQGLHDFVVLPFCNLERSLLGCHNLCDLLVTLHGAHPLAETLGSGRCLESICGGEVGVAGVRFTDLLDDLCVDVVLVIVLRTPRPTWCKE